MPTKTALKLELVYRKMEINQALLILRNAAEKGATHAAIRIRWEVPKD